MLGFRDQGYTVLSGFFFVIIPLSDGPVDRHWSQDKQGYTK